MTRGLWKLPPVALRRDAGGWSVKSERGWGAAGAVFVPVQQDGGVWRLALRDTDVLPLTFVDDRTWSPVPHDHGIAAPHYLCLLHYDQPLARPDRTFRAKLRREEFLQSPLPEGVGVLAPGARTVDGRDLAGALAQVQADVGERLGRYVVRAPRAQANATPVDEFHFAFASCQYPAGMLDRRMAHASWRALAEQLEAQPTRWPQRILMLGDQVYVDATYGLLDPLRVDDAYRLAYEEFGDRETGPLCDLPQDALDLARLMPDDHEIVDNWEPSLPLPGERRLSLGLEAFRHHQRMDDIAHPQLQICESGPGWRLFMADSRTQRELRTCDTVDTATLLGPAQTEQLHDWLQGSPREDLKIVSTAAMLLPRTREFMDDPLYLDNWQGYPASLHALLALLCDEDLRNVVFLSGDAHLGCSARITVTSLASGRRAEFHSYHAPALYAPYPFANESRFNLLTRDRFCFTHAGSDYCCEVEADLLAGGRNGCGWLTARRRGADWETSVAVLR
jgi:hypothetical protein